jgi:signal transduction histidine kinase
MSCTGRAVGLVLLVLATSGCADLAPPGAMHLVAGAVLDEPRDTTPPGDAGPWRAATLPDYWGSARRRSATEGWYRFAVDLDRAPDTLWAVHLLRVSMNAAVWVNGRLVGTGGAFEPEIARNWNRPLLFVLPMGILHAGTNLVDVRLKTPVSSPGFLDTIVIGPEALVRPGYDRRYFQQVTLAYVCLGGALVTLLWVVVLAMRRDDAAAYRWFAAGAALWTLQAFDTILRDPPLPVVVWEWLVRASFNVDVPCFVLAAHRGLGLDRPRVERLLWISALAGGVGMAVVPPVHMFSWMLGWMVWTLALTAYLVAILVAAVRSGRVPGSPLLLVVALAGLAVAAHDVLGLLTPWGRGDSPLSLYIPGFLVIAGGWRMASHLADALGESETLNRELERRVAEKQAQLARNFERLRVLEREAAVTGERERLMQDMHDGMGGHLVSTLAMVESGRFGAEAIADAIRAALEDMRLVVDSLDPVEGDLVSLLAMIRTRLEPRLERHGVRFDWQVTNLPPLGELGPERALHVLRIVQEAVTNVLKHARATQIAVRTGTVPDDHGVPGVFVEVRDDGRGFARAGRGGRGLANMARRAASLGGTLAIEPAAPGSRVRLWIPATRARDVQDAGTA